MPVEAWCNWLRARGAVSTRLQKFDGRLLQRLSGYAGVPVPGDDSSSTLETANVGASRICGIGLESDWVPMANDHQRLFDLQRARFTEFDNARNPRTLETISSLAGTSCPPRRARR
jgi:hypothetical protein